MQATILTKMLVFAREESTRPGGRLSEPFCLSPIFVIPKHSGGLRVFLNLETNNFVFSSTAFQEEESPCHFTTVSSRCLGSHH